MSEVKSLRPTIALSGGLRRLKEAELTWFEIAYDELYAVDVNDRNAFSTMIGAIAAHLAPADNLAEGLGVAPTTVGRWISGANLPPVYARPSVVQYMLEQIKRRKSELRQALDLAPDSKPPRPSKPHGGNRGHVVPIGHQPRRARSTAAG